MINCPFCQTKIENINARYCPKCGQYLNETDNNNPVAMTTLCPRCNAAVEQNSRFCGECGHAISSAEMNIFNDKEHEYINSGINKKNTNIMVVAIVAIIVITGIFIMKDSMQKKEIAATADKYLKDVFSSDYSEAIDQTTQSGGFLGILDKALSTFDVYNAGKSALQGTLYNFEYLGVSGVKLVDAENAIVTYDVKAREDDKHFQSGIQLKKVGKYWEVTDSPLDTLEICKSLYQDKQN